MIVHTMMHLRMWAGIRHRGNGSGPASGLGASRPAGKAKQPRAAAPSPEQPTARRRGRPPKYDWELFAVEVARRILSDQGGEIPKTARGLAPEMKQWCRDEWDREPAESDLRGHIAKVLDYLSK